MDLRSQALDPCRTCMAASRALSLSLSANSPAVCRIATSKAIPYVSTACHIAASAPSTIPHGSTALPHRHLKRHTLSAELSESVRIVHACLERDNAISEFRAFTHPE